MPKVICIDARFWGVKHTGIGRYIENLIDNLPLKSDTKIVLIVPPQLRNIPKLSKFTKYYARFHPYSNLAQFEILKLLKVIKPDLLHVPHFTIPVLWNGKMIITIHDLIKHLSKGLDTTTAHPFIYWVKYLQYLLIVWFAVHKAKHIIVPANFWKREIINRYKLDPAKISVIYEGATSQFNPKKNIPLLSDKVLTDKYSLKVPFVVYTGNLYPHKNIPVLLQSIKLLNKEVQLAIICARDVFTDRLRKLIHTENLKESVKFLGFLTDRQVKILYRRSLAFVTPSLIEGFGLPGIEAMTAGTPVIAAQATCLPEIYGNAAIFFDPYSPKDLADKIKQVLSDDKYRFELVKKGKNGLNDILGRKWVKKLGKFTRNL